MSTQGRKPAGSGRPRRPPSSGGGLKKPDSGASGGGPSAGDKAAQTAASGAGGDNHERRDAARKAAAGARGEATGSAKGAAAGAAKGAAGGAAKGAAKEGAKGAATGAAKGAAKGSAKGSAKGAAKGAQVGSAVPIVGTAIGGAVGGAVGGAAGGAAGGAKGAATGAAKGTSKGAAKGASDGARKGSEKGRQKGADKGRQKAEAKSDNKAAARSDKRDDKAAAKPPSGKPGAKPRGKPGGNVSDKASAKLEKSPLKSGVQGQALKTALAFTKQNKSKSDKRRVGVILAVSVMPILMVGVLMLTLFTIISTAGGSASATDNASGQYAIRDGVPGASMNFYRDAGVESSVPWQVLAAIGSHQTNHGQNAPDGKIRVYGENGDGTMLEDDAWSGQEVEGEEPDATTETTTSSESDSADDGDSQESSDRPPRTTTTVPADAGSLWPVADPPIVDDTPISSMAPVAAVAVESPDTTAPAEGEEGTDETTTTAAPETTTTTTPPIEVEGGPWLGIHLIEQDAWTEWVAADPARADMDPQNPHTLTREVGYMIHDVRDEITAARAADTDSTTTTIEGAEPGKAMFTGDFRGDKASWIENLSALPLKGLSNNESAAQTAETIYNKALAWTELSSSCGPGSGSTLGGGSLPSAGPLKIGDTLAYLGHNIKLTEARWANAVLIADVGRSMGLSDRAQIIAIATSIPETNLLNLQPELDHDSRGLFQQRPAAGWGTAAEVADAIYAARAFYGGPTGPNKGNPPGLLDKAGWETGDAGVIAQSVQGSAHPTRYTSAMPDAVGIHATIKASNATFGITTATPIGSFPVLDSDSKPLPPGLLSGGVAPAPAEPAEEGATTTTVAGGPSPAVPAVNPVPQNVLLIGDSLTVGAQEAGTLPSSWTVDALTSRPTLDAGPIISEKATTADGIVIALGTNDYGDTKEAFATKIDTTMALIGTTTKVWWVNADAGSTKIAGVADGVNAALTEAPARHSNLQVADWSAAVAAKTDFADKRADDGVHYLPEGYKVYAEFLSTVPTGLPTSVQGDCSTDNGSETFGAINIDTGAPVSICPIQNAETNCAVLPNIEAMIAKAASQGVTLTVGNSYRSVARQIELRRSNCGASHYAIYEMPSSSCRPPTAPPGRSNHQKGLAIDFQSCSTRATACYKWLATNAAGFGFYNLPSEAWHWSVDGG